MNFPEDYYMDWQKKFIQGNKNFIASHDEGFFRSHSDKQTPYLTLITCSDSRVHPNVLDPDPINKMFTIQNIGNQIQTSEGSVDYGIYHLKTPLLMILGHSGCGAINAAIEGFDSESQTIQDALAHLSPGLQKLKRSSSEDKNYLNLRCTVDNVFYQVKWATNKYQRLVENGDLTVIGAFYDFMDLQKKGAGKVHIINVNGIEIDNSDFTW